jgi:hypothetical protein
LIALSTDGHFGTDPLTEGYAPPQSFRPLPTPALDVVAEAVRALRPFHDTLLPLIHVLWPVVVMRMRDSVPYIRLHALNVLQVCMAHGGVRRARMT